MMLIVPQTTAAVRTRLSRTIRYALCGIIHPQVAIKARFWSLNEITLLHELNKVNTNAHDLRLCSQTRGEWYETTHNGRRCGAPAYGDSHAWRRVGAVRPQRS